MAISFDAMNYITTRDIAEAIGVSACRVRQLAADRGIASVKVGTVRLWPKASLKQFQRRGPGRPVPQKGKR